MSFILREKLLHLLLIVHLLLYGSCLAIKSTRSFTCDASLTDWLYSFQWNGWQKFSRAPVTIFHMVSIMENMGKMESGAGRIWYVFIDFVYQPIHLWNVSVIITPKLDLWLQNYRTGWCEQSRERWRWFWLCPCSFSVRGGAKERQHNEWVRYWFSLCVASQFCMKWSKHCGNWSSRVIILINLFKYEQYFLVEYLSF